MTARVPIWATVLLCLGFLALLRLLVAGPAIGLFARKVQYILAFVGVLAVAGGGATLWLGRRERHVFGGEERETPEPALTTAGGVRDNGA